MRTCLDALKDCRLTALAALLTLTHSVISIAEAPSRSAWLMGAQVRPAHARVPSLLECKANPQGTFPLAMSPLSEDPDHWQVSLPLLCPELVSAVFFQGRTWEPNQDRTVYIPLQLAEGSSAVRFQNIETNGQIHDFLLDLEVETQKSSALKPSDLGPPVPEKWMSLALLSGARTLFRSGADKTESSQVTSVPVGVQGEIQWPFALSRKLPDGSSTSQYSSFYFNPSTMIWFFYDGALGSSTNNGTQLTSHSQFSVFFHVRNWFEIGIGPGVFATYRSLSELQPGDITLSAGITGEIGLIRQWSARHRTALQLSIGFPTQDSDSATSIQMSDFSILALQHQFHWGDRWGIEGKIFQYADALTGKFESLDVNHFKDRFIGARLGFLFYF